MVDANRSALSGKRVVITRAALQSSDLYERLTASGAIPVLLPLISFAPPQDYGPLDQALLQWKRFDWVLFTSAFAVQAVVVRAARFGRNVGKGGTPPSIAVVGPATKDKAEEAGFIVEHVASLHQGLALAEELGDRLRDQRVLLPRSDRANPDLPAALQRLGANVTEVIAYRTLRAGDVDPQTVARIIKGEADAILFFSPSAVHTFLELVGRERLAALQHRIAMACIGPVTAKALRESGVQRVVMPAEATAEAVVGALQSHFTAMSRFGPGAKPA